MDSSLTIVVGDAHTIVVDGLVKILGAAGHHVVATARELDAFEREVIAHAPDVCILESQFDDGDGIERIPAIAVASPTTRAVVLTSDPRFDTLHPALEAGAVRPAVPARVVAAR